jgi:hypothetical protein
MPRIFDPLTYRHPRSLAETQQGPFDWWTTGPRAEAEERTLRAQLGASKRGICGATIRGVAAAITMVLLMVMMKCGSGT